MRARAVTDVQRSIRRLRTARVIGAVIVVVNAVSLAVDLALVPVMAFLPATLIVVVLLTIGLEAHLIGKLRAQGAKRAPTERPKTFAESVAEAVEAQRQRQWDAIATQAYRAKPPDPERLAAGTGTALGEALSPSMAGMARLAAAMGGCAHPDAEPVDLITGERVAWVCPHCPAELPADWKS